MAQGDKAAAEGARRLLGPGLEGPRAAVQDARQGLCAGGEGFEVDAPAPGHAAGVDDAPARDAVLGEAWQRHALHGDGVRVEHPHDLVVVQAAIANKDPELAPCDGHGVRALVRRGLEAEVLVVHTAHLVLAERPRHTAAADLLVAVGAPWTHAAPRVRLPHAVGDAARSPAVTKQRGLVRTPNYPVHRSAAKASGRHAFPTVHEAIAALCA
mmetsp:Transcript_31127/g.84417  ORF Transcript_31127/g.84417 Transcript_31127/m.84417 type:complete len:212 (+) Transcript_31127:211-846(+)